MLTREIVIRGIQENTQLTTGVVKYRRSEFSSVRATNYNTSHRVGAVIDSNCVGHKVYLLILKVGVRHARLKPQIT